MAFQQFGLKIKTAEVQTSWIGIVILVDVFHVDVFQVDVFLKKFSAKK